MAEIWQLPDGGFRTERVGPENPLAVYVPEDVLSGRGLPPSAHRSYNSGWVTVPGVVPGAAYAALDAVGTMIEFPNAFRDERRSGILHSVSLLDMDKEALQLYLVLFDSPFAATADNAAFDPTDDDAARCLGLVSIPVANFASFNDWAVATVSSIGFALASRSTSLYAQLVTVAGAQNLSAATDYRVRVHILQD